MKKSIVDIFKACLFTFGGQFYLNLSRENLTDDDMPALCLFLNEHPTIVSINLSNNHIGERGTKILACKLNVTLHVTSLDISNNYLGPNGAKHIVSMILTNMPYLNQLRISYCRIGTEGAKSLGSLVNLNYLDGLVYHGRFFTKYGTEAYLEKVFTENKKTPSSLVSLCLIQARKLQQKNPSLINTLPPELKEKINSPIF